MLTVRPSRSPKIHMIIIMNFGRRVICNYSSESIRVRIFEIIIRGFELASNLETAIVNQNLETTNAKLFGSIAF